MVVANPLLTAWREDGDPALAATIAETLASAHAIWPDVDVDDEAFVAHLGARVDAPLAAGLAALNTDDLYLACACRLGVKPALVHFERIALVPAATALRDADMPLEELVQQLRVKLLVADGDEPPRIEQYGGRGSLRGWTRIAVLRTIKDQRRTRARSAAAMPLVRDPSDALADDLLADPSGLVDPELERVRAQYGAAFRTAFATAVHSLCAEARRLLRQHHLHGLTLDALAQIYRAHRVTIARRLAKARAELLEQTQLALVAQLRVDRAEVDQAVGLILSRLELSMERLLASRDDL